MTRFPRPFVLVLVAPALASVCLHAQAAGQPERRAGAGMLLEVVRGMGGGLNLLGVATNKDAQSRLGLTEEQVAAVNKVAEESRAARGDRRGGFRLDMTREEREKAMKEFMAAREAVQKKLAKSLEGALGDKYPQLVKMAAGVALQRGPRGLLDNPEVAEAVGLSKESRQKLSEIAEAMGKEFVEALRAMREEGGGLAAVREKIEAMGKKADTKIRETLTGRERKSVMECVKLGEGIDLRRGRRPGGERRGRGQGGAEPPQ